MYGCCWVGLLGMDIHTHTHAHITLDSFHFVFFVDYGHLWYYYGSSHFLMHAQFLIFFSFFFPPEACVSSNDFLFFVLRI